MLQMDRTQENFEVSPSSSKGLVMRRASGRHAIVTDHMRH